MSIFRQIRDQTWTILDCKDIFYYMQYYFLYLNVTTCYFFSNSDYFQF